MRPLCEHHECSSHIPEDAVSRGQRNEGILEAVPQRGLSTAAVNMHPPGEGCRSADFHTLGLTDDLMESSLRTNVSPQDCFRTSFMIIPEQKVLKTLGLSPPRHTDKGPC